MVAVEEAIHQASIALKVLAGAVMHKELPGETTRRIFSDTVEVVDLDMADGPGGRQIAVREESREVERSELQLWEPLLAGVHGWEVSDFGVVRGHFLDAARTELETEVKFAGRGHGPRGEVFWARGKLTIGWKRDAARPTSDPLAWQVRAWRTKDMRVAAASRPFFREVLKEAVPDAEDRQRARRSIHQELAVRQLTEDDAPTPHRWFFVGSQDRHPGIAVADVNADGFDDIYVMARFGPNQLLLNNGNATFREAAAEFGLDVADHASAAVFADLDNDGDLDAFIGRTLARSVYLENRDGQFVDASDSFGTALPALVSSVNAVDVNRDGLLDLYVSTYAAQMIVSVLQNYQREHPGELAPSHMLRPVLDDREAAQLSRRLQDAESHIYRALPGPPNVLLLNRGGHFERSATGPEASFFNTYQATWADFDRDGDADVYLANDFAPNQMLRNDGQGEFADITEATGTADIGFGMGASWGDYDGDGAEDLYVSNMYSKAGRRITEHFAGLDPRFRKMARGNSLFRNRGATFEKVSGLKPPALEVERAGWSWGGQFLDIDNDADLDLHVLSGYYTAPPEVALPVDT